MSEDPLDSEEFYDLMQLYRHSGLLRGGPEEDVVANFENVKSWVRRHYSERPKIDLKLTSVSAAKPRPCPTGKHWLTGDLTCICMIRGISWPSGP